MATKFLPNYPCLEKSIWAGARLHAFRSGGGLRVVSINDSDDPGYGEHPYIYEALQYAEDDAKAGGRPYKEVYGKLHDHYLTGDSTPAGGLDAWTLTGRSWDITFKDGKFVFESEYLKQLYPPQEISDQAIATGERLKAKLKLAKQTVWDFGVWDFADTHFHLWKDEYGAEYHVYPCIFANGEVGHGWKTVKKGNRPGAKYDSMVDEKVEFSNDTFVGLLEQLEKEFVDEEGFLKKTWRN